MLDLNRSKPLFERHNVPCEFLFSSSSSNSDYNINRNSYYLNTATTTPSNNNNRNNNINIAFFTLRILEGTRPLKSTNNISNGGLERVIRFEVSDECCHIINRNTSNVATSTRNISINESCRKDYSIRKPLPSKIENNNNSDIKFQGYAAAAGVPIMMQQNRLPQQEQVQDNNISSDNNNDNISSPVHIYELEVGESDFVDLRRDQALLVDFSDFAQSFITLLSFCDLGSSLSSKDDNNNEYYEGEEKKQSYSTPESSSNNNFMNHSSLPPFTPRSSSSMPPTPFKCRVEDMKPNASSAHHNNNNSHTTMARFSIVESNQFRELTHLSLNLKCGTDSTMRSYLSTRLRQTINQNMSLKHELEQQILRAKHAERSCQRSTQQYNDLSTQAETEKRELKIVTCEKYEYDRCRIESEYKQSLEQKDEAVAKLKKDYEYKIQQCNTKYQSLENKYRKLQQDCSTTCHERDTLLNTLSLKEDTNQNITTDMKHVKHQLTHTEKERKQTEQTLHKTQIHVASLEKSNENQIISLQKAEEICKSKQDTITELQTTLNTQKDEIQNYNIQLKEKETDLIKSKTLINKFQKCRNETKLKMEKRIELLRKQEDVLINKENALIDTNNKLESLQVNYQTLDNNNNRIEHELKQANDKLLESSKLLEKNDQVITWLNKEINETKLVGKIAATGSSSSSASSNGYIYHRKKDYKDFNTSTLSSSIPIPAATFSSTGNHKDYKDFANTSSIPISTTTTFSGIGNKYNSSAYTVTPDILPFGNHYINHNNNNAYTPRHGKFPSTPMKHYETPLQQHQPHVSWSSNNKNNSVSKNESKLNSTGNITQDEKAYKS